MQNSDAGNFAFFFAVPVLYLFFDSLFIGCKPSLTIEIISTNSFFQETDYEWLTEQVVEVANKHCDGRIVSCLEGGYRIHGNVVSGFARSVAAHVRGLASPGKFSTTPERVAFDSKVDADVQAMRRAEKEKRQEMMQQIEMKELEELKLRMAEEAKKQLALLEAGEPAATSIPDAASSAPQDEVPATGRRGRGRRRGAKVDYVALAARMKAEKMLAEKRKRSE